MLYEVITRTRTVEEMVALLETYRADLEALGELSGGVAPETLEPSVASG